MKQNTGKASGRLASGSLQLRLGAGLLSSLLLVFLLLWLLLSQAIRSLSEDYVLSHLQHDAETLLSALRFTPDGRARLDTGKLDVIYQRPFSGHYFQINRQQEVLLRSRSLWDESLNFVPPASGQTRRSYATGPEAQPLLIFAAGYLKDGNQISIAVAEDLGPIEKDVQALQTRFALAALLAFLVLLALQQALLKYSFRPLRRLQEEIRELERGDIDQLGEEVPAEIRPLVDGFNHLLRLMGERLQRSRNTLGDLAHALKTPLTLLRQASETQDPARLRPEVERQSEKMLRLINHALKRARLAGEGPAVSHFSLAQDLPALLDTLRHLHRDKHFLYEPGPALPERLALDREDMLELLGNLLDNAGKWAKREVRLELAIDRDRLCGLITDDGSGVEADKLELLTRRGQRLDENEEGHGLGLAIVSDIIRQYGGEIRFDNRAAGGLRVQFRIPIPGR